MVLPIANDVLPGITPRHDVVDGALKIRCEVVAAFWDINRYSSCLER